MQFSLCDSFRRRIVCIDPAVHKPFRINQRGWEKDRSGSCSSCNLPHGSFVSIVAIGSKKFDRSIGDLATSCNNKDSTTSIAVIGKRCILIFRRGCITNDFFQRVFEGVRIVIGVTGSNRDFEYIPIYSEYAFGKFEVNVDAIFNGLTPLIANFAVSLHTIRRRPSMIAMRPPVLVPQMRSKY